MPDVILHAAEEGIDATDAGTPPRADCKTYTVVAPELPAQVENCATSTRG
jgi:hypothetical protein